MSDTTYLSELLDLAVRLRVRTSKAKGSYPHGIWQIYKDLVKHHQIGSACVRFAKFQEDPMVLEYWFQSNRALLEDRARLIKLTGRKPRLPKKVKVASQQPTPALLKKSPDALGKRARNEFYRSNEWRILRYKVLNHYGRRCMCCGARPGNGVVMHVDHIKPMHAFPELRLCFENLQVLCDDCNMGKSAISTEDFRKPL